MSVDPSVGRGGDEDPGPFGSGLPGGFDEEPDGQDQDSEHQGDHGGDGEATIVALQSHPEDRRGDQGEHDGERPWILENEAGDEPGAGGVGHGLLSINGVVRRVRAAASTIPESLEEAYPLGEVRWE